MENSVPAKYKITKCVDGTSNYGKLLKKIAYITNTNTSKIQKEIDEEDIDDRFGKMTKQTFLYDYMLNEAYELEDFVNVKGKRKDSSSSLHADYLRGYIYESLWDICIKCNVIPEFSNPKCMHITGKIEKLSSSRAIHNIYEYLSKSKINSGSSGGLSDITLKKDHNHFIIMSSKYYTNEKSKADYDIDDLHLTMKANPECSFDTVLLVHDKHQVESLFRKNRAPVVYGEKDLEKYLSHIRRIFRILPTNMYKDYLSQDTKAWKCVYTPTFHSYLIVWTAVQNFNKDYNNRKFYIYSHSRYIWYDVLMLLCYKFPVSISYNEASIRHKQLTNMLTSYYLPFETPDIKSIETQNDEINVTLPGGKTIVFTSDAEIAQSNKNNCIYFQYEQILALKTGAYNKIMDMPAFEMAAIDCFGSSILSNTHTLHDSTKFQEYIHDEYIKYPQVQCIGLNGHKDIASIFENIFGSEKNHMNNNIYNQLIKYNGFKLECNKILWIADKSTIKQIKVIMNPSSVSKEITGYDFIRKRLRIGDKSCVSNHEYWDVKKPYNHKSVPAVIICLIDDISFEILYEFISNIFTISTNGHLIIIDNNNERSLKIKARLNVL